jgi:hypothetical protein
MSVLFTTRDPRFCNDLEFIEKGAGQGEWSQINRAVGVLTPQFARWNADFSVLVRESVMTIAGKE